jgi:sulfide dehydrogenase cytochrome subunit
MVRRIWQNSWLVCSAFLLICTAGQASSDSLAEGFRLSQTCAGCHGTAGASPGNTIPIIGGQTAAYLADSLQAYKSDERKFYVMNIIAKAYSDSEIDAISLWFASKPWVNTVTSMEPSKGTKGKNLATACVECHGPSGQGTALGPRIAGQPVTYMIKVMREYKSGSRGNANAMQMVIASILSEDDIEVLAHHYAGLR